ncbi:MAG: hypothetical protein ABWZ40_09105 [Caulobacterales bacterium]
MSIMLILLAIISFLVFAAGACLGGAALYFMRKEKLTPQDEWGSQT